MFRRRVKNVPLSPQEILLIVQDRLFSLSQRSIAENDRYRQRVGKADRKIDTELDKQIER